MACLKHKINTFNCQGAPLFACKCMGEVIKNKKWTLSLKHTQTLYILFFYGFVLILGSNDRKYIIHTSRVYHTSKNYYKADRRNYYPKTLFNIYVVIKAISTSITIFSQSAIYGFVVF